MAETLLRPAAVTARFGVSRATIWRWERRGDFPARRRLGPGVVGWLESELDEWARSRPIATSTDPDEAAADG